MDSVREAEDWDGEIGGVLGLLRSSTTATPVQLSSSLSVEAADFIENVGSKCLVRVQEDQYDLLTLALEA